MDYWFARIGEFSSLDRFNLSVMANVLVVYAHAKKSILRGTRAHPRITARITRAPARSCAFRSFRALASRCFAISRAYLSRPTTLNCELLTVGLQRARAFVAKGCDAKSLARDDARRNTNYRRRFREKKRIRHFREAAGTPSSRVLALFRRARLAAGTLARASAARGDATGGLLCAIKR